MSDESNIETQHVHDFYLEEYKALREEITTKLKDRLEFNRWGIIGIAALYSYILSNPGKPILFWVPVGLSVAMIAHFNEEHRVVAEAAEYIREEIELWAAGGKTPGGWETYREPRESHSDSWLVFWRRWPLRLWDWSPVPFWIVVFALTLVIAIGVSNGRWPWLMGPVTCLPD